MGSGTPLLVFWAAQGARACEYAYPCHPWYHLGMRAFLAVALITSSWALAAENEWARPFAKEPLLGEGIYYSHGSRVEPASLYEAQLKERFGEKTEKGVGH